MTDKPVLSYKDTEITIREAVSAWNKPLEKVFKTVSGAELPEVDALNVAAADEKRNCCRQLLSGKEHPRMLPQAGTADRIHSGLPGNEL